MSVARKRAKVKKKRSAKKKVTPKKGNTSPKGKTTRKKKKRVSVNTKPRPRKPKPRISSKKSRSEAAKKGWETRRTNQLREKAKTSPEAHIAFLRRPQVKAQIDDDLIRTGLIRPGMVQSNETQILSRLIVAKQIGDFDEKAHDLAIEFDWDVRDVYTLWNSP